MIIGEKVRSILEHGFRHVNFNDQHLARIIYVEDEEHINYYNLEAIRKIIDFQFVTTRRFLAYCGGFYVVGFLIPFLLSLLTGSVVLLNLLYTLCLFTQIFFMLFELMQIKQQKLDYFKDLWNLLDTSQFVTFTFVYLIKMLSQFQTDSILEIVLQVVLLIQSFYKAFYFIRIDENFNFFITISCMVVKDIVAPVLMLVGAIMAFTQLFTVLHLGINDPTGEYREFNNRFIKLGL